MATNGIHSLENLANYPLIGSLENFRAYGGSTSIPWHQQHRGKLFVLMHQWYDIYTERSHTTYWNYSIVIIHRSAAN